MLALFAAALVQVAPAEAVVVRQLSPERPLIGLLERPDAPRTCRGAGRLQTSFPEPALLFREQDRAAARARRLIDLPPGEVCLLGGSEASPAR